MLQSYHNKFLSKFEEFMPDGVASDDYDDIMHKLNKASESYGEDPRILCDRLMNNPKFYERFCNKSTSVADNERFERRLIGWVKWKESE